MHTSNVTIMGTCPLLVNNPQTANPLGEMTKKIKELTGIQKRSDAENMELQRVKWMGAIYYDPKIGPYLPSICVWRSIHDAAKITKQGKQVERGLQIMETRLPIEYDGPRDPAKMLAEGDRFMDVRDANASGKKIMAVRPIFNEWMLTFTAMVQPDILNPRDFEGFVVKAGKLIGVGTYRRLFGRFDASFAEATEKLAA